MTLWKNERRKRSSRGSSIGRRTGTPFFVMPLQLIYTADMHPQPLCTLLAVVSIGKEAGLGVALNRRIGRGVRVCAAPSVLVSNSRSECQASSPVSVHRQHDSLTPSSDFMELQQQAWTSNLCQSYAQAAGAEAAAFASAGQAGRSLGGYPFPAMNNSPLHNPYAQHHSSHHPYLTSYQSSVTSCPPSCPSPPRDGKSCCLYADQGVTDLCLCWQISLN